MPLGILLPLAIFWAIVLGAGYDVVARLSPEAGDSHKSFVGFIKRALRLGVQCAKIPYTRLYRHPFGFEVYSDWGLGGFSRNLKRPGFHQPLVRG